MNELLKDLITDEIVNKGLATNALVEFLVLKGIIDRDEFYQYLDDYAKEVIKRRYPDIPLT